MENNHVNEISDKIEQALSGDKKVLEELLTGVYDPIFHLSLRMLGTIHDAEDATQEILIKIMTHLSTFRGESAFTTWAFKIASNHLKNYKKHMFANAPLSFEFYGSDIRDGKTEDVPDLTKGVDKALLEKELKWSCTNVMLQCLDAESRCIFIFGTMFKADSRIAGEILDLSPEAYRQRLSRIRKKVADFLDEYCGHSGKGMCSCKKRVNYAIATHRLSPDNLEYTSLEESSQAVSDYIDAMEKVDDLSIIFDTMPAYRSTKKARKFLTEFLNSDCYSYIANA